PPATATFARLQTEIFDVSCSSDSCHSSIGRAGNLVLEAGDSWGALVNHQPSNPVAAAEGLMRGMPGNPERDPLMAKNSRNLQAGEGQSMPFNAAPLTDETIDVVHAWIAAGAPKDGMVPGDNGQPLGDSGDSNGPFNLQPPEHGVQIKTTSPPVPLGQEQ